MSTFNDRIERARQAVRREYYQSNPVDANPGMIRIFSAALDALKEPEGLEETPCFKCGSQRFRGRMDNKRYLCLDCNEWQPKEKPAEPAWTPKVGEWVKFSGDELEIIGRVRLFHKGMAYLKGAGDMSFNRNEIELLASADLSTVSASSSQPSKPLVRHPDGRVWMTSKWGPHLEHYECHSDLAVGCSSMTRVQAFRVGAKVRYRRDDIEIISHIRFVGNRYIALVGLGNKDFLPHEFELLEPATEDSGD